MSASVRPNLYELLKPEFSVFDTLLDVGCGGLNDLVDFEFSPFKRLVGIEKEFQTNAFGDYYRLKTKNMTLSQGQARQVRSELVKSFMERFMIYDMVFLNFGFESNACSFIICNKVLHFYPDENRFAIIKELFNALQKDGILYLKINHNNHPNNTDLNNVIRLSENVYQNKEVPEDIRYLINTDVFTSQIEDGYTLLPKYTSKTDKTLTLVLKK